MLLGRVIQSCWDLPQVAHWCIDASMAMMVTWSSKHVGRCHRYAAAACRLSYLIATLVVPVARAPGSRACGWHMLVLGLVQMAEQGSGCHNLIGRCLWLCNLLVRPPDLG
jgi:hypothetical protein